MDLKARRTVLAQVGLKAAADGGRQTSEPHFSASYNLLFCDDLDLIRNTGDPAADEPWATLLSEETDLAALAAIAESESEASCARALAYSRLRSAGVGVAAKCVLAFIVEVPMEDGLEVLAAYSDGQVRYLHHSGETVTIESPPPRIAALAADLARSGDEIVDKVPPCERKRLPPPEDGRVRLTFLVSDGLYFCDGAFAELQRDTVAGPLLRKATELLELIVEFGCAEDCAARPFRSG